MRERKRVDEPRRDEVRPADVRARLYRERPPVVDRVLAETTVGASERRQQHFPVDLLLVRVITIGRDVCLEEVCIGCGVAGEGRHVEGHKELEWGPQGGSGGEGVGDLRGLPRVRTDVERKRVDAFRAR